MFKITRVNDSREWLTEEYKFIVYENGRGKELIEKPIKGASLILPPYNVFFKWMTSEIVEIISEKHFKTKNSEYVIEEN